MTAITARKVQARHIKPVRVMPGWYAWNDTREDHLVHAFKEEDGWKVTHRASLTEEPQVLAQGLKSLLQVSAVIASLYNEGQSVEEALAEVAPAAKSRPKGTKPEDVGLTVGTILYSSWGYDQTNIDFYQVVGTTAASVRLRPIGKMLAPEQHGAPYHDAVLPAKDHFTGEEFIKRVKAYGPKGNKTAYVDLTSYSSAQVWDGTPKFQTGTGFGH